MNAQQQVDRRNAEFWDELCGSGLARQLGITERNEEGLRSFDLGFLELYPYLDGYLPPHGFGGAKVLEIGLGYGTLSQMLMERDASYYGLDIAPGPVGIVSERMRRLGKEPSGRVVQGSALRIPFPDAAFDYVYTIGCLHHTGDLDGSVAEVHRVLRPGGTAVVMLYNRHGFRQLVQVPAARVRTAVQRGREHLAFKERVRAMYDTNEAGEAAPHTDFVSPGEARRLFHRFSNVKIDRQNFDTLVVFRGRLVLVRERFLKNIARFLGLDLYITATK